MILTVNQQNSPIRVRTSVFEVEDNKPPVRRVIVSVGTMDSFFTLTLTVTEALELVRRIEATCNEMCGGAR